MEKSPAFLSLAVLAIVAAALMPRDRDGGQTQSAASTKESRPEKSDTHKPSAADDDDPFDALDVLAESLSVQVSPEALRRMAVRENDRALKDEMPEPRRREALEFLNEFAALARSLPQCAGPTSQTPAVERSFAELIACYFDRPPADVAELRFAALRHVAARQGVSVNFLIALLPDPIDSFTGWQFDPMLDAISQAISASDYIFERTHFPDTDADHGSHGRGRAHEEESSVVLYRRHLKAPPRPGASPDEATDWGRERLVLLIVHENPSAGVHSRALVNAIRLVTRWNGKEPTAAEHATIRVLGPTFSGSADSVARELGQAARRGYLDNYAVRFISGSATDDTNKKLLEEAVSPSPASDDATKVARGMRPGNTKGRVSFSATVQPDSVLVPALARQIRDAGWSRPIAVLFEGNTQYGRGLLDVLRSEHDGTPAGRMPPEESNAASFSRSDLILLPFPMNVSRIRNRADVEKQGLAGALGMPTRFQRLEMDSVGKPADQIPQLSPATTASYVELALSGMLRTMRTERVRTIALMATDPRDKLFLARQISRDSPNVSIFTVESDSLYIHPDYSSYLQGALVASTYPLYSGNQRWSYGFEGSIERREFASGSALGIYNAALALLNYDEDGQPLPRPDHSQDPPHLVEYGAPGDDCAAGCVPPVWISVIGGRTAWPVRAFPMPPSGYVFRVQSARTAGAMGLATFPSPSFIALFVALGAGLAVCWLAARPAARPGRGWRNRFSALVDGEGQTRGRAYMLVGVTSLIVIEVYLLAVSVARLRLGSPDSRWSLFWSWTATVAAIAGLAVLTDLARRLISHVVAYDHLDLRARFDVKTRTGWTRVAALAFCAWAVVSLMGYVWAHAFASPYAAVGFVTRAVDLGSGVSPTLPVLCLGAAFILWSLAELARLRSPHVALADQNICQLMSQTVSGGVDRLSTSWRLLDRSTLAVPGWSYALTIALLAATCLFLFDPIFRPLVTIEGRWFGRFVSSVLLLVQGMISLSLLQFLYLWSGLRRLLDRMAWHKPTAYLEVPRSLYPPGLFPKVPRLMELQPLVASWKAGDVGRRFQEDMNTNPDQLWSRSETWTAILEATQVPDDARTEPKAHRTARQCLVEMASAIVIRDALARLQHNLVFVIGSVVLVFLSYTLFPFQLRTFLAELGWIYVALTFSTIVVVLVQMKRNDILRRLTALEPGKPAGFDSAFFLRIVVFALLPLLTLFAAQFPDIGGVLLSWAGSAKSVLP